MTITQPICMNCKNYDWDKGYCLAFPVEIPFEIIGGDNDHSKPIEGQKGDYVFELIEKER